MLIFMEDEKSTAFGERLKWARKKAGLVQKVAAKRVGMSQGTLAELERTGQGSSYTPALAALYGVNSVWLATGKGDPLSDQESPIVETQSNEESPTPASYAEVVRLFGEAPQWARDEALRLLNKAALKSGGGRLNIGNDKSQRLEGNDGGG